MLRVDDSNRLTSNTVDNERRPHCFCSLTINRHLKDASEGRNYITRSCTVQNSTKEDLKTPAQFLPSYLLKPTTKIGFSRFAPCEGLLPQPLTVVDRVLRVPYRVKVRKPTDFGFVLDDMGNMPAMEVDASRIRGTEATVEIRHAFGEHHCPDRFRRHCLPPPPWVVLIYSSKPTRTPGKAFAVPIPTTPSLQTMVMHRWSPRSTYTSINNLFFLSPE